MGVERLGSLWGLFGLISAMFEWRWVLLGQGRGVGATGKYTFTSFAGIKDSGLEA